LRKKVEDSEATFASLQAPKERELYLLGKCIVMLETKLAEDNSTTQAKINDLEVKLAAAKIRSKRMIQDHSDIQKELSSVKVKAELDSKALEVRISHSLEKAAAQYAKAEDLLKSNLDVRAKLHRAKE
jgi:hypothetical protein